MNDQCWSGYAMTGIYSAGVNRNKLGQLWKTIWCYLLKVKIYVSYGPANPLLDTQTSYYVLRPAVQFNSVTQLCPTLCDPMNRSMPGLPIHHQLPECTQTHVHWVGDAIQPSHPLLSPSPPALNLSQHHGLFKWVTSSHQMAKVLEFQLQYQSFQWISRTDLL